MKIRRAKLEGRDHLVVPVVMIRVGTWNGSQGPVRYPADALRDSVPLWDGKPIVVYHPKMFGAGFAGHPEIFNRQKVGVVFSTRFDGDRLRAEAWLDVARLEEVDARVSAALRHSAPVGVSTGLCVTAAENGASGETIARALTPDHLAILPDQPGACSLEDGAGLLKNSRVDPLGLPVMNFGAPPAGGGRSGR